MCCVAFIALLAGFLILAAGLPLGITLLPARLSTTEHLRPLERAARDEDGSASCGPLETGRLYSQSLSVPAENGEVSAPLSEPLPQGRWHSARGTYS